MLHSGSVEQIIVLLENIEESKNNALMKEMIPLLEHPSPKVRLAVLNTLYYYPDHSVTKHIYPLLKDQDEQVRARAFACLLAHTRTDRVAFINDYMNNEDPAIRGAALIGLATETRGNLKMQKQFSLEQQLHDFLSFAESLPSPEEKISSIINAIRAIGFGKIRAFYPFVLEKMYDENHTIAQAACRAAGNTEDVQFIKPLLYLLADETMLITAHKALAKFDQDDLIPELIEVINEKQTSSSLLVHLPALAKSMDTKSAIDFLLGLIAPHHHPELKAGSA
jgi:AAA family ATP:ADP antiporter